MTRWLQANLRRSRRANFLGYALYLFLLLVLVLSVVLGIRKLPA